MNPKDAREGKITIGRPSDGNREGHVITIEVTDAGSGVQFFEGELSAEDMMLALTGHGYIPVKFAVRGLDLIGTTRETKTELVMFDKYEQGAAARVDACLEEFEKDGWRGDRSDMMNGHRMVTEGGKRYQRVNFSRHVRPDGSPVLRGAEPAAAARMLFKALEFAASAIERAEQALTEAEMNATAAVMHQEAETARRALVLAKGAL